MFAKLLLSWEVFKRNAAFSKEETLLCECMSPQNEFVSHLTDPFKMSWRCPTHYELPFNYNRLLLLYQGLNFATCHVAAVKQR